MKKIDWLIVHEEPLAGYTLINILRVLIQNRFRMHPKYWLRFLYSLVVSFATAPLRIIEKIVYTRKIKTTEVKVDPLFVIGHYRTGSTYLIKLLSLDNSKGYVSNMEAYGPNFFLAFPKITKWILDVSLPEKRPMDNVLLGSTEPTEEEYSIGSVDKYAYFNGFIFPRNFELYSRYNSFDECPPKDLKKWKKRYQYFVKKMTYKYKGKMMYFKNPANTYRIPALLDMYPNAKFIHIYRNPYELFASIQKWFRTLLPIYALQTWNEDEIQTGLIKNYREMYHKLHQDRKLIPKGNIIDVNYEELIKEPVQTIEKIYTELGIDYFDEYKESIQKYADSQVDFQVNRHIITDEIIKIVNEHWNFMLEKYGYEKLEPKIKEEETIVIPVREQETL